MKWLIIIGVLIMTINLASALTTITECQNLTTANEIYVLGNSIQSNITCIHIKANGITLNGNNYSINYSANSTTINSINAIQSRGFNDTYIRDLTIIEGKTAGNFKDGIHLIKTRNVTIDNVNITFMTGLAGNNIALSTSTENFIIKNSFLSRISTTAILRQNGTSNNITIINNNFSASTGTAILISFTSNNITTISENGIKMASGTSAISLSSADLTFISNNTFRSTGGGNIAIVGNRVNITQNNFSGGTTAISINGNYNNANLNYAPTMSSGITIIGGSFNQVFDNIINSSTSNGYGMSISGSTFNNFVYNNTFQHGSTGNALYLQQSRDNIFENNTYICTGNCNVGTIYFVADSNNNTLIRSYILNGAVGSRACIGVNGNSVNATVQDVMCNVSNGVAGLRFNSGTTTQNQNMTMINVTNLTGDQISYSHSANGKNTINWWVWGTFQTDYWNGSRLATQSNISGIENITGNFVFENITTINGLTERQLIRFFISNSSSGAISKFNYAYNFTAQNLGITQVRKYYNPTNNFNLVFPFSDCMSGGNCNIDCSQNYDIIYSWNLAGSLNLTGSGNANIYNLLNFTGSGANARMYQYPGCKKNIFPGGSIK